MEIYEYAQLYLSLATFVAAFTIILYSRNRSSDADPETKRAFRPLYLFAIALIVYAIGTFISFQEAGTNQSILLGLLRPYSPIWQPLYRPYTLYLVLVIEIIILAAAASMIMRQSFMFVAMIIMSAVCLWLLSSALNLVLAHRVSSQADLFFQFGSLVRSFMLIGVSGIFIWISYDLRRGTTAAMAFALVAQLMNLPDLYGELLVSPTILQGINLPVALLIIIVAIALMGPSTIAFSFLRPDQKASFELFGYGVSYAGPVLVISGLQAQELTQDPLLIATVGIASVAIMLAGGTSAYLYGRWSESKQLATFFFMLAFFLFAVGQMIGLLGNTDNLPWIESVYVEFIISGLALSLLSITSIYAAGYRSAGLIPLLLFVPIAILFVQNFPTPIEILFVDLIWLVIPLLALFLLPVFLFIGVWWRMRKANAPGRLRPLGIGLGILLFLAIRIPFLIIGAPGVDPGYALVTISFVVSWLALTGRLDRTVGMRGF
ncbi:MAG: hypothetical protein ACFFEX_03790 [Candidatus Thorarchaeota archaeon]